MDGKVGGLTGGFDGKTGLAVRGPGIRWGVALAHRAMWMRSWFSVADTRGGGNSAQWPVRCDPSLKILRLTIVSRVESHPGQSRADRSRRNQTDQSLLEQAEQLMQRDCADLAPPVRYDERSIRVLERVRRYAKHDCAIIALEGESGTGKNRMARYIHQVSRRATRPFREVSLAALDDGIAGSELFGHVPGAFTDARQRRDGHFASANGGTLFLDELGKASVAIQKKLLRVIETAEVWPVGSDRALRVDVRLVTATNIPLQELVARGDFLPDLYARLGCFRIRIPPLRQRPADIAPLVEHFVVAHGASFGYATPPVVHPDLMLALERATWPFNVRELESTVMRLLVDADGAPVLTLRLCVDDLAYLAAPVRHDRLALSLETVRRAVAETGSVAAAARTLGVHRATLYRQFPDIASDAAQTTTKREARQN